MQKLVTSEQIRKLESKVIGDRENVSLALMEKAGSGLAKIALEYKEPYLVICGKGNNGGDGIVAARYLLESKKKVFLVLTSNPNEISRDAKTNFELIKDKIDYFVLAKTEDKTFLDKLSNSNTVIECLLGTGRKSDLGEFYEWIIKSVNNSKKHIIACDIPTGVDADTGNISNVVIKADVTVTFGYPKIGLLVYPARKYVGKLKTIDIGLSLPTTNYFLLNDDFLKENLPKRFEDSNKGTFGKTLLVCGSKKYPGAAFLSSRAASSIGSGLTTLSSPEEVLKKITKEIPEVTYADFSLDAILEESEKSSVIVIGPGLGTEDKVKDLVFNLLKKVNIPIVLDADGINVLSGKKEILKEAKKEIVITPHPKEFSRLTQKNLEDVLNNKIELTKNEAHFLNATVVLKGPATIIGTKDGNVYISGFANAALAKGGTGDVLAGFIGGLIAQGLEPSLAACVGVYLHGKCGEVVAKKKTVFSVLPQDLINVLPDVIRGFVF